MSKPLNRSFPKGVSPAVSVFLGVLLVGTILSLHWITVPILTGGSLRKAILWAKVSENLSTGNGFLQSCTNGNIILTCPKNYTTNFETEESSAEACPEYFRWIHEDLRPWKKMGITRDVIESSKPKADFRLVVVKGIVYVEKYRRVFQTRDVFTIWGILQLLKLYPGKLPDLDIMFACDDMPLVQKSEYQRWKAGVPPPLFHYCKDDRTLDIVFPDWTFWGWPEVNVKPWVSLKKELEEGNNMTAWIEREPYAYWKGNTRTGIGRRDLFKCNPWHPHDWYARIFHQDWARESKQGFKGSSLASQCKHRYKIFIEGNSWSVSQKYILACDSMTLLVSPRYYDIITRSLLPLTHYWPIRENAKCKSLKFAVNWGNNHQEEAQKIGKAGTKFIQDNLKLSSVYEYMFHVLNEYAKLLRYQPTVPPDAVQVCSETMACHADGLEKIFMMESIVMAHATRRPCTLPPSYDPLELQSFLKRKNELIKQVEVWEETGNVVEERLKNLTKTESYRV